MRVAAVDAALELMEGDDGKSATAAAREAGERYGVDGRSVMRWAESQGRALVTEGRRAQASAAAVRAVVYDLGARKSQRARLNALIEAELERLERVEDEDRSARLGRLANAHRALTETQHRDELHAMRMGDPDAMFTPADADADHDDTPNIVLDFEEALRKASK